MKVYITKYALTAGILEKEAEVINDCAAVDPESGWGLTAYYHGNDWHPTKTGAIMRAKEMQEKKLISLEKNMKKIKAMRFD